MRKLKRMIAIGSIVVIIVTAAGCSSTNESTETTTTSSETTQNETTTNSEQVDNNSKDIATTENASSIAEDLVVFGKVTAINGTTVTLAVGDMPQGNKMEGGQTPDAQGPNKDDVQNNQESARDKSKEAPNENKEAPSSDASQGNTQATSGEKPSQQPPTSGESESPDMSSLFVESGESLTITIEDESLIKIMSGSETTTGSLSDIAVDSILSIQYDDSQNITSITVTIQPSASK